MSSESLKDRIWRDIGAPSDGVSLSAIRRIREWVYRHTTVSATAGTLLAEELLQGDLELLIQQQTDARGGYWCGGIEMTLRRVYALFEVETAGFFYGVDDVYSHVATLVRFGGDLRVQDAYFNTEWANAAGVPAPIGRLLANLGKGELFSAASPSLTRTVMFEAGIEDDHWVAQKVEPGSTFQHCLGGLACRSATDMASFQTHWTFCDKALQFLQQAGLPGDFRYFALFPQAVSESGAYIDRPSDSKLLGELANASAEALRVLQGGVARM